MPETASFGGSRNGCPVLPARLGLGLDGGTAPYIEDVGLNRVQRGFTLVQATAEGLAMEERATQRDNHHTRGTSLRDYVDTLMSGPPQN